MDANDPSLIPTSTYSTPKKSHQQHTHTRLETIPKKLLIPFHLKKNIERPFCLDRKSPKDKNGTASVNGIIHGSSLDPWHLMTQVLASLPPARSQVKKVGSCGSLARQTISKGLILPATKKQLAPEKWGLGNYFQFLVPASFQVLCESSGRVILSGRSMFVRLVRHLIEICIYFWADGPGNI